jgi:phosphatidylserine decarboxylase
MIMRIPIPPLLRTMIYTKFGQVYGLKFEDMDQPLESYKTFNQFFTRTVKKREIPKSDDSLVVPGDSVLISLNKVTGNDVLIAKQVKYSLGHFLTGEFGKELTGEEVEQLKENKDSDLYSMVFYLAPGDYHRYHSMANSVLSSRTHVAGELYTVKDTFVSTYRGVYEINERVVVDGKWKHGRLFQVYVSATNVGSMTLNFDPDLNTNHVLPWGSIVDKKDLDHVKMNAGQEVGRFNMGSTVVAVVEVPKGYDFKIKVGDKVRYGDLIGQVPV